MPDDDFGGPFEEVLPARDGSDTPRAWGFARLLPAQHRPDASSDRSVENPPGCFNVCAVMRRGGWSSLHYHPHHHNEFSICGGLAVVATKRKSGAWSVAMLGGKADIRTLSVAVDARIQHLFFALQDNTVVHERYIWTGQGCRTPWIKRLTGSGFSRIESLRPDGNRWIDAGIVAARMEESNEHELAGLCAVISRQVVNRVQ